MLPPERAPAGGSPAQPTDAPYEPPLYGPIDDKSPEEAFLFIIGQLRLEQNRRLDQIERHLYHEWGGREGIGPLARTARDTADRNASSILAMSLKPNPENAGPVSSAIREMFSGVHKGTEGKGAWRRALTSWLWLPVVILIITLVLALAGSSWREVIFGAPPTVVTRDGGGVNVNGDATIEIDEPVEITPSQDSTRDR